MNSLPLFTAALGLQAPWQITEAKFEEQADGARCLHLWIDFERGAKFSYGDEQQLTAYDTVERQWRHLDFFQHKCFLHCRVPRVQLADGKVKTVSLPWARPGSGFTLLFEAYVLQLVELETPVNKVGQAVRENPHRLWTIIRHYVGRAYQALDHSKVKQIGIDETSTKKGHHYITAAVDLDQRRVVHVTTGKSKESVGAIRKYLTTKDCCAEQIEEVCIDMSPSFIAGVLEEFPQASITFDRFHVVKLLNEAMDRVRKAERREHDLLKGHKYTFLKSEANLSDTKRAERDELLKLYPTLGDAYRLKILFNDFWDMQDETRAEAFLNDWVEQARASGIVPFIDFVATLKRHWYGVISFITSRITNGILEGTNTKIQLAKRRARGYRNLDNFIAMIYLLAGKLDLRYPFKSA